MDGRADGCGCEEVATALTSLGTGYVPDDAARERGISLVGVVARLMVAAELATLRRALGRVLDEATTALAIGDKADDAMYRAIGDVTDRLLAVPTVMRMRDLESLVHLSTTESMVARAAVARALDTIIQAVHNVAEQCSDELLGGLLKYSSAELSLALFNCTKIVSQLLRLNIESMRQCLWNPVHSPTQGHAVAQLCRRVFESPYLTVETAFATTMLHATLLAQECKDTATFVRAWMDYWSSLSATVPSKGSPLLPVIAMRAFLSVGSIDAYLQPAFENVEACALDWALSEAMAFCEQSKTSSTAHRNIAMLALIDSISAALGVVVSSANATTTATDCMVSRLDLQWSGRIEAFLRLQWDDPADGIASKTQDAFVLLLKLLHQLDVRQPQQSGSARRYRLAALLTSFLAREKWMIQGATKAKYRPLGLILDYFPASDINRDHPSLLTELIHSLADARLTTVSSDMIISLLGKLLKELKETHGDGAAQKWESSWMESIAESLSGSHHANTPDATEHQTLLRKNILTYVVPGLVRLHPCALDRLVTRLVDNASSLQPMSQNAFEALVATLKEGRLAGLLTPNVISDTLSNGNEPTIPVALFSQALHHADDLVRVDALGFVCLTKRPKDPLSEREFQWLRESLPENMTCVSPDFRQRLMGTIDRLLDRIRESLACLVKEQHDLAKHNDTIASYCQFINWLTELCLASLYPGTPFQRTATTLSILQHLLKFFTATRSPLTHRGNTVSWPRDIVSEDSLTRISWTLLERVSRDSFDRNRQQAYACLLELPVPLPGISDTTTAAQILSVGLRLANSVRGQESDGGAMLLRFVHEHFVARLGWVLVDTPASTTAVLPSVHFLEHLVTLLSAQVDKAERDLEAASQTAPMFGLLSALRYIFADVKWQQQRDSISSQNLINRLIELTQRVITTVLPPLSHAAPEGNNDVDQGDEADGAVEIGDDTMEGDDDDDTLGPTHQVVNSCCWRSLRAASLLLVALINEIPWGARSSDTNNSVVLLSTDRVVEIGNLFATLLCKLRHLGAITSVYDSFLQVNRAMFACESAMLHSQPSRWLEYLLDVARGSMNVSITRRSAGLPYAILAILISEPSTLTTPKALLPHAVNTLITLAQSPLASDSDQRLDIPQVHAFNVLRAIFRNAALSTHVLPFITEGIMLALQGFQSASWAVRNCATMLFAFASARIFGTHRNTAKGMDLVTPTIFFQRYPELYPFLLQRLSEAVASLLGDTMAPSLDSSLFPILTLLSRLQPAQSNATDVDLRGFVGLVTTCCCSRIHQVRSIGARALAPLIASEDALDFVRNLLAPLTRLSRSNGMPEQNVLHGCLLECMELVNTHLPLLLAGKDNVTRERLTDLMEHTLLSLEWLASAANPSPSTRALFLNLVNRIVASNVFFDEHLRANGLAVSGISDAVSRKFCAWDRTTVELDHAVGPVPGWSHLQVAALQFKLDIMLMTSRSHGDLTLATLASLRHDAYEVRQCAANWARKHLVTLLDHEGLSALINCLCDLLIIGEPHRECVVSFLDLLHTILAITTQQIGDSVRLNRLLHRQLGRANSVDVALSERLASLPLLGALSQSLANFSGDFLDLLDAFSREDQSLPMRQAAIDALSLCSRLVEGISDADLTVRARWILARLLQDDDADIRVAAAGCAAQMLRSRPLSVPYAWSCVMRSLVAAAKQSPPAAEALHVMLASHLATMTRSDGNASSTLESLVQAEVSPIIKLFYREEHNFYREPVLETRQWASTFKELLDTIGTWPIAYKAINLCLDRLEMILLACRDEKSQCYSLDSLLRRERIFLMLDRLAHTLAVYAAVKKLDTEHQDRLVRVVENARWATFSASSEWQQILVRIAQEDSFLYHQRVYCLLSPSVFE